MRKIIRKVVLWWFVRKSERTRLKTTKLNRAQRRVAARKLAGRGDRRSMYRALKDSERE